MKFKNYALLGLSLVSAFSCQNVDDDIVLDNENLASIETESFQARNNTHCVTKTYDYTGADLTSFMDLSTGQTAMWPGNIITENSLEQGKPSSIPFPGKARNSIEVGVTGLSGTSVDLFVDVDRPDIGRVSNSINKILNNAFNDAGTFAGKTIFNVTELKSKETVSLALDAGYSGPSVSLSGKLNLDFNNGKNKVAVTVKQEFYEVTVSPLRGLLGKFGWYNSDIVDQKDFTGIVTDFKGNRASNPALFVKSISYGRFLTLVYESSESVKDISAALEFKYKGVGTANASAQAKYNKTLSNTSVSVHQIGGNPRDTFAATIDALDGDIKKIIQTLEKSAVVSKSNPGYPIGYNVGIASNGKTYSHSYSQLKGTYQDCEPVIVDKIRVEPYSVTTANLNEDHGTSGLELYGNITVDVFDQQSQRWRNVNSMYWGYGTGTADIRVDHYPFTKVSAESKIGEGRSMDFKIEAVPGAKFRITGKTFECSGDNCSKNRYGDKNTTKVFEYRPGSEHRWYYTDQYTGTVNKKNSVSFSSNQIGDKGFTGNGSARANVWLYLLN
ncbi:thiol-activated cytolysin [Tenacibaculum sp. 190524A02b]|uniref:Thiol-activated cytolysin n=1 Tax=Tenacibaculum vairaonense TaxID=3137860 RepID=A0ABM9PRQ3_9FLAO